MRVLFFGNHTVGVRALTALAEQTEIVGVIAHPLDPEDGVRYESVADFAAARGWPLLRAAGRDTAVPAFVAERKPDLLWITDYRYLLPTDVIALAPQGAINLHPSLLPKYRGRAPVNWAILRGETELGLTAHRVDAGMDTGNILAQEAFHLSEDEDVGDALERLYPLYERLTRVVVQGLIAGTLKERLQEHALATAFPRRRPEDGRIDWSAPARDTLNLVRAVAAPYPGAFTRLKGQVVRVWSARCSPIWLDHPARAGEVCAVDDLGIHVACGSGVLCLTVVEPSLADLALAPGALFEQPANPTDNKVGVA